MKLFIPEEWRPTAEKLKELRDEVKRQFGDDIEGEKLMEEMANLMNERKGANVVSKEDIKKIGRSILANSYEIES